MARKRANVQKPATLDTLDTPATSSSARATSATSASSDDETALATEFAHLSDDELAAFANGPLGVTVTLSPQMVRARREQRRRMIADLRRRKQLPTLPAYDGVSRDARQAPGRKRFALNDLRHVPVAFASRQAHDAIMVRGHYESRKLPGALSEYFGNCPHVQRIILDVVPMSKHFTLTDEHWNEHYAHLTQNPHAYPPNADPEDGPYLVDVLVVADPDSGYPDHRFLFPTRDLYLLDERTREPLARAYHTAEQLYSLYPHKLAHVHRHPVEGPSEIIAASGVRDDLDATDPQYRQPSEQDGTAVAQHEFGQPDQPDQPKKSRKPRTSRAKHTMKRTAERTPTRADSVAVTDV